MDPTRPADHRQSTIDLATVHETLALIRDDLAGVSGLAAVETALTQALAEIELARPRRPNQPMRLHEQLTARFVPWKSLR